VVILGSTGLALGCLVRVSAQQFPLLFLQGTNLLMTFGMSIVLSFWAPSLQILWSTYLAHMLLVSTGRCMHAHVPYRIQLNACSFFNDALCQSAQDMSRGWTGTGWNRSVA
jgi:hypothetical protein